MIKQLGQCKICGQNIAHDDDEPVSNASNVGDYDFICYSCQFKAMDNGTWDELKSRYL